ncbi:MAG: GNAT family N-acetyltransferase [Trebonia sp.]
MATEELHVTRESTADAWRALDGTTVAGEVRVWRRPDGRKQLFFDTWRADAYLPLTRAVARDLGQDLYTMLDDAEFDAFDACVNAGFAVRRRESHYRIPTDPALTGLDRAALPDGMAVLSARDADIGRLMLLDDDLRQDVPGSEGWHWEPQDFRDETFGRAFDPETYLIAVAPGGADYAGLTRVWINRAGPRLGLIAVRVPYRRRGLARALLRQVFQVLHDRGQRNVTAEADDENEASVTLLTSLGARRTGGSVELVRRHAD